MRPDSEDPADGDVLEEKARVPARFGFRGGKVTPTSPSRDAVEPDPEAEGDGDLDIGEENVDQFQSSSRKPPKSSKRM